MRVFVRQTSAYRSPIEHFLWGKMISGAVAKVSIASADHDVRCPIPATSGSQPPLTAEGYCDSQTGEHF